MDELDTLVLVPKLEYLHAAQLRLTLMLLRQQCEVERVLPAPEMAC